MSGQALPRPLAPTDFDLNPHWHVQASSVGPGFAQNLSVEKAAAYNGNDSDDDGVPDELPPTFFVADAHDT